MVATPMIILIFNSFFMCPYLKETEKTLANSARVSLSSVPPPPFISGLNVGKSTNVMDIFFLLCFNQKKIKGI